MTISNISTTNQPTSVNRAASLAITHAMRKEHSQDDRGDSTVVTLSVHARDLHRSDNVQTSSQEHVERISAINRTDGMAQEKLQANAKEEAKALAAMQKENERFNKRINTYA